MSLYAEFCSCTPRGLVVELNAGLAHGWNAKGIPEGMDFCVDELFAAVCVYQKSVRVKVVHRYRLHLLDRPRVAVEFLNLKFSGIPVPVGALTDVFQTFFLMNEYRREF